MVIGKEENGSPIIQRMPWPYFPFLNGNEQSPIVQNLDRVLTYFPSSIDTIAVAGIQKQYYLVPILIVVYLVHLRWWI